jgi:adenylate cyclase
VSEDVLWLSYYRNLESRYGETAAGYEPMAADPPRSNSPERRLAAILAADVAAYSRLMGKDEEATTRSIRAHHAAVLPLVGSFGGRVVDTAGDGILATFPSAVRAVECAVAIQEVMKKRNRNMSDQRKMLFRIGVNLGDVIYQDMRVYGDGVNVASRIEQLAEPGGVFVSGTAFDHVRGKVDFNFEHCGDHELKNIAQPVTVYRVSPRSSPARAGSRLTLPDKPSLVVLPFDNMSADASQDFFADGIVEEITAALSRVKSLFVIARNSAFTYKGRAVNAQQVGRDLGVRYLIEGSVRRVGDRVRITAQLIDAATGNHLWADRYEGGTSDVFDLQDRITENVVGAIQPSILSAEIDRARRKRPESLAAYDYMLRAMPLVWSLEEGQNREATSLLQKALAIDPKYALALSLYAWCRAQLAVYNWTDTPTEAREEALRLAKEAAAISRDDPMVLAILGAAHSLARDHDIADVHLERRP